MECPFKIEPHQIQGLDYIHIFPVVKWLVKKAIETREAEGDSVRAKIQQTKMLVMCQRFGDWFLFRLVQPYSSNQKNIMKVGSKSLLTYLQQ